MEQNTTPQKATQAKIICFFSLIALICLAMLAGAFYLFNEVFPMARPIQLPETEAVLSASVYRSTDKTAVPITTDHLQQLFTTFQNAEPTRKQALNDTPTVRPYYAVEVKTADRSYLYFIYSDNGLGYIEIPYEGIYETNSAIVDLIAWNGPTE